MKQSTKKATVTTAKKGELHFCMKCRKQLTIPGQFFCDTKKRDCRPSRASLNLSMRESNQGGGEQRVKRSGSQTKAD